jgi:gliding motility-associated-like protein
MKTLFTRLSLCTLTFILLVFVSLKATAVSITSFTPRIGVPGTLITIKGTDLSAPTAFIIGNKPALILANNDTTIVAMIMPGATSGNISITNIHGTATSPTNYMFVVSPVPDAVQGKKLTGNDNVGTAAQGTSVAMSANGRIVVVGGSQDNSGIGAAWVYTSAGGWKQKGHKLVGKDSIGQSNQGTSVAISASGSTVVVGGPGDDGNKGAVWVFTLKDSIWAQQGPKLTISGTAGTAPALFGASVSLSATGNTLVAEAAGDDNNIGAAYVFVRTDTTWAQQGGKLVATGSAADNTSLAGDQRVALSADGNTFVMGAHTGNNGLGGAWVFTRTGTTWAQQGSRLFGSGSVNQPNQGNSVAISADGNSIAIGGPGDDSSKGAAWMFTRTGTTWTQQGNKIKAIAFTGAAQQGSSVNLNADGKVLLVGAKADQSSIGSAAVFTHRDTSWTEYSNITGDGATAGSTVGNSVGLNAEGIFAILGGAGDAAGVGAAWVAASGLGSGTGGCGELKIHTLAATSITSNSATINGSVDATGCYVTTVVFEYSTSWDMSNARVGFLTTGPTPLDGTMGLTNFTSNLTDLLPSTTYYYRIVGANYCTEITDGPTLNFTTPAELPGSGLSAATIPTAFTPNNDGINDRWELPFLSKYTNCSVKIFNRNGQIVFTSTGYSTSWDGRYKNSILPSGAYFYIIDLKDNQKAVSGSVNLIK